MADVGDVLASKYRLIRQIGKGGMGVVYEAVHEELGKQVAVKLLLEEAAETAEAVARFDREARAASATGHRSIVDIYDVGRTDDGDIFMVMELMAGRTLGQVLKKVERLEVQGAVYVACQVLSALDAAHGVEVIHRDLKPENIFLVDTGRSLPDVKLLDFGISKMVDRANPHEKLTATGVLIGSPSYMAPEQIRGARDVDGRADLYAVGVILYRALTGKLPHRATNTIELLFSIVHGKAASPRELRPDLPEALESTIMKAMGKLEDRHGTAVKLLEELLPILDDRTRDAVSLPERLRESLPDRSFFS